MYFFSKIMRHLLLDTNSFIYCRKWLCCSVFFVKAAILDCACVRVQCMQRTDSCCCCRCAFGLKKKIYRNIYFFAANIGGRVGFGSRGGASRTCFQWSGLVWSDIQRRPDKQELWHLRVGVGGGFYAQLLFFSLLRKKQNTQNPVTACDFVIKKINKKMRECK